MKTKVSVLICVVLFLINITGCSTGNSSTERLSNLIQDTRNDHFPVMTWRQSEQYDEDSNELKTNSHMDTPLHRIQVEDSALTSPQGICCMNQGILVADQKKDRLILCSPEGKILKTVGKTGNGKNQFQGPYGVTVWKNRIYVIDSGNHRIAVLNQDLNMISEISIPDFKDEEEKWFTDIAIDRSGEIYICGVFLSHSGIYHRSLKGKESFKRLKGSDHFYGSLREKDGSVYALNKGYLYAIPKNKELGERKAKNALWKLSSSSVKKYRTLPTGMDIGSFLLTDHYCIGSSSYLQSIKVFDLKSGKYVSDLVSDHELSDHTYMDQKDGKIYLADPDSGNLYWMQAGNL